MSAVLTGFPQALEIVENHLKSMHGKIMEFEKT